MSLRKIKGSPYYYYDFTIEGNRFRESTGTNDYKTALQIEAHERLKAFNKIKFGEADKITLTEICGDYWLATGQYLKTKNDTKRYIREILEILGTNIYLEKLNEKDIARLVARLRGKIIKPKTKDPEKLKNHVPKLISNATVNRYLETLSSVINYARKLKYQTSEVAILSFRLQEAERIKRSRSAEEIEILLSSYSYDLPVKFTELLLLTTLRINNVISLNLREVDFINNEINVKVKSKKQGGKVLKIPMVEKAKKILLSLEPNAEGYFFHKNGVKIKSFKRAFETAKKKAGLDNLRLHDIRHTAASLMHFKYNVPLAIVSQILGHSDIKTTMIYLGSDYSDKKNALEMLSKAKICQTYEIGNIEKAL